MSRAARAAIIGLITGIVGIASSLVSSVAALEDTVALRALFLLRGPVDPPRDVVVVSIDETTAVRAELPPQVRDWPRSVHARLLDRLVDAGASVIAFDVEFFRHHSDAEEDRRFAEAIARARRVVLVQRLEVATAGGSEFWQRRDPVPPLADSAIALAPAPVPDLPFVTSFWSFVRTPHAGEVPAFAAVALQIATLGLLDEFVGLLEESEIGGLEGLPRRTEELRGPSDLLRVMQRLRTQAIANPAAMSRALEQLPTSVSGADRTRERLRALATTYAGSDMWHLNWYGPPGTVCTIPYEALTHDIPVRSSCSLRDAVVFVGAGAARVGRAGQIDTYHSVFDGGNGVDFSGVEIHATAVANLLTSTALRRMDVATSTAILGMFGLMLGICGYMVRTRRRLTKGGVTARLQAAGALGGLVLAYAAAAYFLFSEFYIIVPLFAPGAVLLPTALVLTLVLQPSVHNGKVLAVCVITDVIGSTKKSGTLPTAEYAGLMDRYRRLLRDVARKNGGVPADSGGDAVLALWVSGKLDETRGAIDPNVALKACRGAIAMLNASLSLREPGTGSTLAVRIGMHSGEVPIQFDADGVGVRQADSHVVNAAAGFGANHGRRHIAVSENVIAGLRSRITIGSLPIVSLKDPVNPIVGYELLAVDDHRVESDDALASERHQGR